MTARTIRGFTAADVGDQGGKTFVVTGANSGIGFEACKVLAARGARVLMACRNRDKAETARDDILTAHPEADLRLVDLDLSDLDHVRAGAEAVLEEPRVDVLVNNAGLMIPPRQLTKQGFESQMGVNHLGAFALTGHLMPKLLATPHSRVVNTSSNGHRMGSIDFEDVAAEESYVALTRYGASKLANLLHAYELDRRFKASGADSIAVVAHPGGTDTELFRHLPGFVQGLGSALLRPFLNQPAEGAWPTLCAATHPELEGSEYFGPKNFQIWGPAKQVKSNRASRDPELAQRLWDWSVELTGVDPGLPPAS